MVKMEREMAVMEEKGMTQGIEVGTHRGKNNIIMSCRARGRGGDLLYPGRSLFVPMKFQDTVTQLMMILSIRRELVFTIYPKLYVGFVVEVCISVSFQDKKGNSGLCGTNWRVLVLF